MVIEKVSIDKLKVAGYNPRKALKKGDVEYNKLSRSIEEFGYVEPIIWNKVSGTVVGGHQRLTVLKDKGYSEVDVVVVELSESKEKALNVALNKVSGTWDEDLLSNLLSDLRGADDIDELLTGFDVSEIDLMLGCEDSSEVVDNTEVMSFIDDLMETDFYKQGAVDYNSTFNVTFTFKSEVKEEVLGYIKENGKDHIISMIIDTIRGGV